MKRFLAVLALLLCFSARAAIFNNSWTTNNPGQVPFPLVTTTSPLYPLMIRATDTTNQTLHYSPRFYLEDTNGFLRGILSAGGGAFTNSLTLGGNLVLTNGSASVVFTNDAGVIHETSAATRFHVTNLLNIDASSGSVIAGAKAGTNSTADLSYAVLAGYETAMNSSNSLYSVVGIGIDALFNSDLFADYSVFIGERSGANGVSSSAPYVVAIGPSTLDGFQGTQIDESTFIGGQVGFQITASSGQDALVAGWQALNQASGDFDRAVILGAHAAEQNTGNVSDAFVMGYQAAAGNSGTLDRAIIFGNAAGSGNTNDLTLSTLIGAATSATGTNAAAFGANAASVGDNQMAFGNALNSYTFPGTGGAAFAVTPTVNGSSVLTNAGITISQNGTNGAPAINFTNTSTVTWARNGSNWTATAVGSSGAASVSVNGTNVSTANFTNSSQLSYQVSGSNITATVAAAPANGISDCVTLTMTGTNVDANLIDFNSTNVCYTLLLTNNAFFGDAVCINVPATTKYKWIAVNLIQDSTGGRTVTFTNSIFAGVNGSFAVSTQANALDIWTFSNSPQTNGNVIATPVNNLHR